MLLIKNGYIKTMAGPDIENGQILMDGNKIVAVGKDVQAPADAEVIDATGKFVTPGLIDAHCHTGLREDGIKVEGEDVNEFPNNPIACDTRAMDGCNPMDVAFTEAYQHGVTSVVITTGSRNVVGGQASAIKTYGRCIDNMIIKHPVAVKIALGENTKATYGAYHKAPCSRLGIASLLRSTLFKAKAYKEAIDAAKGDPSKMPKFDMQMEALLPVMRKEIPLKAHSHRADDICTVLRVAREFDVKVTLEHCTEGYLILDEIVKSGFPVIVGPSMGARSKYELKNQNLQNAKILSEAGVKIAIMTDAPVDPLKYLTIEAQLLIRAGLEEETAWKAMTINPAEIVGISDRVGSLEPGKDADVVIFSANPLDKVKAVVETTIINGKVVYQA